MKCPRMNGTQPDTPMQFLGCKRSGKGKFPVTIIRAIRRGLSDSWWWIRHRTTDRYDIVWLRDLKPGYYEPEDRLFHSMMQILCDFVELELPWHSWCCEQETPKPKGRERQKGLEYLDWEASLRWDENHGTHPGDKEYGELMGQAISAMEIKAVYLWYRDVFQKRRDVGDESGMYVAYDGHYEDWAAWRDACKRHQEIEEQRYAEDAAYMKRLVDIRRSMWT